MTRVYRIILHNMVENMHVKVTVLKDRKRFIMTHSLYMSFSTHSCEYIMLDLIWTLVRTLSVAGFYGMTRR